MNEWTNLARSYFLSYCHIINRNFESNWHHELIAGYLDDIADGKSMRLIISLPPRHGKSFMISQHFPTFYLGRNPKHNIISTAYNQSLAEDFGIYVKNVLMSEEYKTIFPINVNSSSKSKKRFSIMEGGNYYAIGRGGAITGRGGHLIIIDDLIKNEHEARSETHRKQIVEWYKNTLRTRLMPNGSIIIVQTRWHQDDLIGELLRNSGETWEYVKLPAIDQEGKALWPKMYPLQVLETIKKEIGTLNFEGLYQQEPTKSEGNIIKSDWIQRYTELPKIVNNDSIITFDLTFKGKKKSDKGKGSDYVVGHKWQKVGVDYYLLDMIRGQFDFTETLFHMKQFLNKHKDCTNIVIEDAANASAVYSTIKQHISGVRLWKPETSKEARLMAVAPLFEAKNIYIPKDEKYDILVSELLGFPLSSHDDTVDACSMALLNLKTQSGGLIMSLGERIF